MDTEKNGTIKIETELDIPEVLFPFLRVLDNQIFVIETSKRFPLGTILSYEKNGKSYVFSKV